MRKSDGINLIEVKHGDGRWHVLKGGQLIGCYVSRKEAIEYAHRRALSSKHSIKIYSRFSLSEWKRYDAVEPVQLPSSNRAGIDNQR
ncbi:MAG TPA: hypothetical protein V6C86_08470 [Oculatellaceae cyanobacterium]